jgi:hypothetical protein
VDKNGDLNKTLCSANIGQVYEAFLCALKDYTLDSRGDVGAWYVMICAASRQNQHSGFVTSIDLDQPGLPRSLIMNHAVSLPTLLQVENMISNSMDPDQTAWMCRLVWNHAGRKPIMLVLSWRGSFDFVRYTIFCRLV